MKALDSPVVQNTDKRNKSCHKFISCPWNHSWLQVSLSPLSFQSSCTMREGGNEIRPHCAGGTETIRELWLTEVRLENGSFTHLSSSFLNNKTISAFTPHFPNCLWLISASLWTGQDESATVNIQHRKSWHVLRYLTWGNYSCHLQPFNKKW